MTTIKVKVQDTPVNDYFWHGDLVQPYVVINQGVTRLFFSDVAYDKFLGSIV